MTSNKTLKLLPLFSLILFLSLGQHLAWAGTAPSVNKTSQQSSKQAKLEKRKAKLAKLAESKFVQWLVKRAMIRAEKKKLRQELKAHKGDKEARKALRTKHKDEVKAFSRNLKLGIVLVLIGIVVGILVNVLGTILIVIGLILIILELAKTL